MLTDASIVFSVLNINLLHINKTQSYKIISFCNNLKKKIMSAARKA